MLACGVAQRLRYRHEFVRVGVALRGPLPFRASPLCVIDACRP
jgi:hypothetical protein